MEPNLSSENLQEGRKVKSARGVNSPKIGVWQIPRKNSHTTDQYQTFVIDIDTIVERN